MRHLSIRSEIQTMSTINKLSSMQSSNVCDDIVNTCNNTIITLIVNGNDKTKSMIIQKIIIIIIPFHFSCNWLSLYKGLQSPPPSAPLLMFNAAKQSIMLMKMIVFYTQL